MYSFKLAKINKEIIHYVGKERYLFLLTKKADNILILFSSGELLCDVGLYTSNIDDIDNKKTGYIGTIHPIKEIDSNDKKMLIHLAITYMKNSKIEKIIAPLDRDTWSSYRTKTKTYLNKPFYGEPIEDTSKEYEALKFKPKYNYFSTLSEIKYIPEIDIPNITFRHITEETIEKDLEKIYELSIEEFKDNLFAGSINKNIFMKQYLKMFSLLQPIVCVAEHNNEIIGFMLGFDGNNCFRDKQCFVMKTIAVKKEFRGQKIGNELFKRVVNKAEKQNYTHIIGALIYQDNISKNLVKHYDEEIVSEYVLLEKDV